MATSWPKAAGSLPEGDRDRTGQALVDGNEDEGDHQAGRLRSSMNRVAIIAPEGIHDPRWPSGELSEADDWTGPAASMSGTVVTAILQVGS